MVEEQEIEDFLEHFGVKGMKWGVRNEDDGGSGRSGSSEPGLRSRLATRQAEAKARSAANFTARAAKKKVRISEIDKEIASLPDGDRRAYYKKSNLKYERELTQRQIDADMRQAGKIEKARLTPTQKKVLIGAAVVGGVLAAHYLSNNHERIGANIRRIQSERTYGSQFRINKDLADTNLSASQIRERVSASVNPNFRSAGGQMNCRRSTFAYELRRRGYDVEATTSSMGMGQSETGLINALIKGDKNIFRRASLSSMVVSTGDARSRPTARDLRANPAFTEKVKDVAKLKDALAKHGPGARGEVVFNEEAFGHSLSWENIKGVPHLFDNQKGAHFPVTAEGLKKFADKWGHPKEMDITRLDNLDLDLNFLGQWVKNVGS